MDNSSQIAKCFCFQLRTKVYDTVLWGRSIENKPFFHLAVNLSSSKSSEGLHFFNGIEVVVQDVFVQVDEAFVTHVLSATYDLLEFLDRSLNQDVGRRRKDYTNYTLATNDMVYARFLLLLHYS